MMVVFTCNHCGDSVKKPRVEKHGFVCRKPKDFTCADCLKVFKGEEYVTHIKCVTEEERYAARGSVSAPIIKKGEVKQESWVEMVRSIIDSDTSLNVCHRNLLNSISHHSNVPRKKHKFINFVKSSSGGRVNLKDIEAIWNIIEKHKQEQTKFTNGDNNSSTTGNEHNEKTPMEQKKKNTEKHENDGGNIQQNNELPENNHTGFEENFKNEQVLIENNGLLKKKRKNKMIENNEDGYLLTKKKKSHLSDEQCLLGKNGDTSLSTKELVNVKTKKNKVKYNDCDESALDMDKNNTTLITDESLINDKDTDDVRHQKKKRKNKCGKIETDSFVNGNDEMHLNENTLINNSIPMNELVPFSFEEKIYEILKKKAEISLKKLQKHVLNSYLVQTNKEEITEKLIKKFSKKLRKLADVEVNDNLVKLT